MIKHRNRIKFHFKIKERNGRITIIHHPGDTYLNFEGRKPSTFRDIGKAFIKIADMADRITKH